MLENLRIVIAVRPISCCRLQLTVLSRREVQLNAPRELCQSLISSISGCCNWLEPTSPWVFNADIGKT